MAKTLAPFIWSKLGYCPICTRKAFLAAAVAWLASIGIAATSSAPRICTLIFSGAFFLTVLWIAHITAFTVRKFEKTAISNPQITSTERRRAMSLFVRTFTIATVSSLVPKLAMACDPNEECSGCLIHNPFGGCIQYGNDPLCELRKAACQQCANAAAIQTGLAVSCIGCVLLSSPADPVCISLCGNVANAEAARAAADC